MTSINYYEVLEVSEDASLEEIVSAKNRLAKKYHPDMNVKDGIDTTAKMQEILEAYSVLSDETKRKAYDAERVNTGQIRKQMQNFDFSKNQEENLHGTFIECWQASDHLFEIISSLPSNFFGKKDVSKLRELAAKAMHEVLILRSFSLPMEYWHPAAMNWMLLRWYQNRNLQANYLATLYARHLKNDYKAVDRMKIKNEATKYERQIKKLLKHE